MGTVFLYTPALFFILIEMPLMVDLKAGPEGMVGDLNFAYTSTRVFTTKGLHILKFRPQLSGAGILAGDEFQFQFSVVICLGCLFHVQVTQRRKRREDTSFQGFAVTILHSIFDFDFLADFDKLARRFDGNTVVHINGHGRDFTALTLFKVSDLLRQRHQLASQRFALGSTTD